MNIRYLQYQLAKKESTNSATAVSTLDGDGCGALACIDAPNTIACGSKESVAEIISDPPTTYYLVHAHEDHTAAEFELSVAPSESLGGGRIAFVCPAVAFAPPRR